MVPWPVALLTLFYGVLTAVSAATLCKVWIGVSRQPILAPLAWLTVSATAMCGLPLLKPWARRLAIAGSIAWVVISLSFAALLIASRHPVAALCATFGAGVHLVIIRYLRRPTVKSYFGQPDSNVVECSTRNA